MKMTISVGRCLKKKTMLMWVKEYMICCFQRKTSKCKYWVLNVLCFETQMVCSGWLKHDSLCLCFQRSSKCLVGGRCNGLELDTQTPDQINFVYISIKIYLRSLLYHHYSQEYFFKWSITSSPYLEMLLINMLNCSYFFSVIAMFGVSSCNLRRL